MNTQEREKIIKKLCEKYKMFLVKEFSCLLYFSSEGVNEFFMTIDLANMSVVLYELDECNGSFFGGFKPEPEFILDAKISNTFDGIVKIVDNRLKQYYFAKKEQLKRRVADL